MGNFYTNYTLRGPTQQMVAAVLAGRTSTVTLERNGCDVFNQLKQCPDQPRSFPDDHSFQNWFDRQVIEAFEDRVRRGIWVRMSEYEVKVAQSNLPPSA